MTAGIDVSTFGYNPDTARFVNLQTGRFVSGDSVRDLVQTQITSGADRIGQFADRVVSGQASLQDLQNAMISHLQEQHTAMHTLGRGGWRQLTASDFRAISAKLESEFTYLENFLADIENGNLSAAQIKQRLQLYSDAIYGSYYDGLTEAHMSAGFDEEAREIDAGAENCDDCLAYAAMGYQPINTLPSPGEQSRCMRKCRCKKVYRKSGRRNQRGARIR